MPAKIASATIDNLNRPGAGDIVEHVENAAVGRLHQRVVGEQRAGFDEQRLAAEIGIDGAADVVGESQRAVVLADGAGALDGIALIVQIDGSEPSPVSPAMMSCAPGPPSRMMLPLPARTGWLVEIQIAWCRST